MKKRKQNKRPRPGSGKRFAKKSKNVNRRRINSGRDSRNDQNVVIER